MKYLVHMKNNKDKQQTLEIEKYGKIIYVSDIVEDIIGIEIIDKDNVEIIKNLDFVYKIQKDRKGYFS